MNIKKLQLAYSLWKKPDVINKTRFLLGLVVGTATVVPSAISQPVQAQSAATKAQGRQGIVTAYNKQAQALLNKDVPAFMTTISPDCLDYSLDGSVSNYAQIEVAVHEMLEKPIPQLGVPMRLTRATSKILSISWRGSEAIVMSQTTVMGNVSKYGKTANIEIVGVSRDFWTPTRTGWKMRQSVTTQMTSWLNGKKVKSVFR